MMFRSLVFRLEKPLPDEVKLLMEDFRLAVNNAIRCGLQSRVTSRNSLTRLVYRDFRKEHPYMYSQHLVSAFEVAASALKNHRRRLRSNIPAKIPYIRRLFMKAENQAYKLDRKNGILDLPIRAGFHIQIKLLLSNYHRKYLDDESLSFGSLILLPDRVIITLRKYSLTPYAPESILSLDTNERSIDGVLAMRSGIERIIKTEYPEIAAIQETHHRRRSRIQKKKAYDRRTVTKLCRKEGKREHHRVEYRLHQTANTVLSFAEENRSLIVLEDLTGIKPKKGKAFNRRISIWPRRKLQEIIEYKAAWQGISIIKVNPINSSRRCPACGKIQQSRKGTEFKCECGWHIDRHINASINLLKTAAPEWAAGGLRFGPSASQHDVVMVLCGRKAARSKPNEMSGVRAIV
jgi:IS605 OrfB family transposase